MWTQDLPDLWTNTASFSAQNTSCICFLLKDNLILVVNGVSWPCSIYNVSVGPWLMTCHVFVWDWTRSQVSHCPRECYHAIVTSTSFCLSVSNMTRGTCGEGLHSWHSTVWISLSPFGFEQTDTKPNQWLLAILFNYLICSIELRICLYTLIIQRTGQISRTSKRLFYNISKINYRQQYNIFDIFLNLDFMVTITSKTIRSVGAS